MPKKTNAHAIIGRCVKTKKKSKCPYCSIL